MRKVSLFKGEPLWNFNGFHVCDENGMGKVVEDEHLIVEMNVTDEDYVNRILPCIRHKRYIDDKCQQTSINISLTNEVTNGLRDTALVVPSEKFKGMYRLKYNQNICEHCTGFIETKNLTFDDTFVPKKVKKTARHIVPVYVDVKEIRVVQTPSFNSETNRWELTDVEKEVIFQKQVEDVFDLYDKSGNIIGTHKVLKTEVKEVDEIDLETGEVIYDNVLGEDNLPVQIQKFNKRYINENGNVISKEEYEQNGGAIVIDCTIKPICPILKETLVSS
jgi:hypothetical protein